MIYNFIKKESPTQVLTFEFSEIFKNSFFTEHLQSTAISFILIFPFLPELILKNINMTLRLPKINSICSSYSVSLFWQYWQMWSAIIWLLRIVTSVIAFVGIREAFYLHSQFLSKCFIQHGFNSLQFSKKHKRELKTESLHIEIYIFTYLHFEKNIFVDFFPPNRYLRNNFGSLLVRN